MLPNIPPKRLLSYFFLVCLLPFIFVYFQYRSNREQLEEVNETLERLLFMATTKEKNQATNQLVRDRYKNSDHFYLIKNLEPLRLRQTEIDSLEKILQHKGNIEDDLVKKRYEFLTEGENKIVFSEGAVQFYPGFKESIESLAHPVEVDLDDLKDILTLTEGLPLTAIPIPANRPQLIFLDFKVERKQTIDKNETLSLNMKLLKREYASS